MKKDAKKYQSNKVNSQKRTGNVNGGNVFEINERFETILYIINNQGKNKDGVSFAREAGINKLKRIGITFN